MNKGEHVSLILPVYYTQTFKTKKDKTFLVNLNWWRNSHYYIKNEVKTWFTEYITKELTDAKVKPIKGKYELAFVYYYKNVTSDLDNVCAMANKHFNDAAQLYGLVQNDNVKYCVKSCYYVGEKDKDNPRIEVFIRKWKEDK